MKLLQKTLFAAVFCALIVQPTVTEAAFARKPLSNHFGMLSYANSGQKYTRKAKAGWLRPHPGPMVWDMMQQEQGADYDFAYMDAVVRKAQRNGLNVLMTIWPYAEWDQVQRENVESCAVYADDHFLPRSGKSQVSTTVQEYLPEHRCNPHSWSAYRNWVIAVVERYDGDGVEDMPNLRYGVKHWEVMNEPDLPDVGSGTQFYKQGPTAYYTLLKKTSTAIHRADEDAKVLIAGAAGTTDTMMDFYDELFTERPKAKRYFDIGNVHCISCESDSMNVEEYQAMLERNNVNKPVWVTEAEKHTADNRADRLTETRQAIRAALELDAEKIFLVNYSFVDLGTEETSSDRLFARDALKRFFRKMNRLF